MVLQVTYLCAVSVQQPLMWGAEKARKTMGLLNVGGKTEEQKQFNQQLEKIKCILLQEARQTLKNLCTSLENYNQIQELSFKAIQADAWNSKIPLGH